MGFGLDRRRPDDVLEPGCGTGNFIRAMQGSYTYTGIETDPVSAAIAAAVSPDADILAAPMQRCTIPAGSWDLAVGNVPYSNAITIPYGESGRRLPIHDWFILSSLDALRPGGVTAQLTSRYTLDKTDDSTRRLIASKAELVAAVRLPVETFRSQAGTEAVSDILVLRKRETPVADPDEPWTDTTTLDGVPVNRWILDHPENTIGDMGVRNGAHGPEITVTSDTDPETIGRLAARALERQSEPLGDLHTRLGRRASAPQAFVTPTDVKRYEHFLDQAGHVWYGAGDTAVPVHSRTAKGGDQRLADMIRLRDMRRGLLDLELDPEAGDEEVSQAIHDLDAEYDRFAEHWGRLADPANRRAWTPANTDPGIQQLQSLETTDAEGRYAGKAAILSRRVATPVPPIPDHADTPAEALAVSIDRTGGVDMALIARLLDADTPADAAGMLGDMVIADPVTGRWATSEEYLSGDIAAKLDAVDRLIRENREGPARAATREWLQTAGILATANAPTPDEAASSMASYRASGAWTSLTDPIHAESYVDTNAWGDTLDRWEQGRWARAVMCDLIDDMKPGTRPVTTRNTPDGRTVTETDETWEFLSRLILDDPGTGNGHAADSPQRVLYKLASADPGTIDRATLARTLAVATRGGSSAEELRGLTDPELWEDDSRTGRYGHMYVDIRLKDPDGLARALRDDPAITEYALQCRVRRENGDTDATPTREGLERYRAQRAAFLETKNLGPADPIRLDELERLGTRLEHALPERLGPDQISVGMGAAWVPPHVVHDFARETFLKGTEYRFSDAQRRKLRVSIDKSTGNWQIKAPGLSDLDGDVREKYSTNERNPFQLLEAALNGANMDVTVPDADGKGRVKDAAATAAAWDKLHNIERAFDQWVWKDPARADELAGIYNRRFNNLAPRRYDGSKLTLPGITPSIELRDHQKDAVARILQSHEGTLVAHVVGAGKTYTTITACHEAVRLGKATKPMIAVPNHLTGQWASDWERLYPGSRILAMTEHDMSSSANVGRFWNRVASGDWDAVIVGHSRFSQLHVSAETRERYYEARKWEMTESIRASRDAGNDFSVKQLQAQMKRLETRLDRLRGDQGFDGVTFDRLGVDMLAVDEAHTFKNLAVATSMNVAGMTVAASAKCEDLLDKCQWLRDNGHASNIVFATGTPVSNTMAELYNMQRYLAPNLLKSQGVEAFGAWAKTFGRIVESVEVKPESNGFQVKQRFASFHNLPELMNAFHTFADVRTAKDLDLDVPECDIKVEAVEASDEQKREVKALGDRADKVRARAVEPEEDNMLRITGDGRKIALDPKLLDPADPDREPLENGKVERCAENIAAIHDRYDDRKAAQLVFCDASTEKTGSTAGEWNIYRDLKRRLIDKGIPENEIAFISDAGDDPRRRDALFEKVRDGDVRVLIGSTEKLGTGTNVQKRLAAIHDLDCPWRPSDLEQRLGRIQRQGNTFDHVTDYRYVTVGTFDSYLYQIVERKQRFISQIFTSDNPAREAADLDETVLGYADIKALAAGNPIVAERMQTQIRLDHLTLLKRAHATHRAELDRDIRWRYEPARDLARKLSADATDDQPLFLKALAGDQPPMLAPDRPAADRAEFIDTIQARARRLTPGQSKKVAEYRGLDVIASCEERLLADRTVSVTLVGIKANHEHMAGKPMPGENSGAHTLIAQLDRIIKDGSTAAEPARQRMEQAERDLAQARDAVAQPWDGQAEYDELTAKLARLDHELDERKADGTTGETGPADDAYPGDFDDPATRTEGELMADPDPQITPGAPNPAQSGPTL